MPMNVKTKRSLFCSTAIATLSCLSTFVAFQTNLAATFGEQQVDQSRYIAVAAPIGNGDSHQLLILEQLSSARRCWQEHGTNPTLVDPLLTDFDFTGICGRSTDANGYSIRVAGQDLGLNYRLRVRKGPGTLLLVGIPDNTLSPEIVLGSTQGQTTDFAKINLYPGWSFTKRTFGPRALGHIYLSAAALPQAGTNPQVTQPLAQPRFNATLNATPRPLSRSAPRTITPRPATSRSSTTRSSTSRPKTSRIARRQLPRRRNAPYGDPTRGETTISSGFGKRPNPFGGGTQFHSGMDLYGSYGTPIVSTGFGKVVKSGKGGGYGHHIVIDHGNGFETLYGHLLERKVKKNQRVANGQFIGYLGSSGRTTGPHLHYEIRFKGKPIDPKAYFFEGRT